jgi:hypothetical protein
MSLSRPQSPRSAPQRRQQQHIMSPRSFRARSLIVQGSLSAAQVAIATLTSVTAISCAGFAPTAYAAAGTVGDICLCELVLPPLRQTIRKRIAIVRTGRSLPTRIMLHRRSRCWRQQHYARCCIQSRAKYPRPRGHGWRSYNTGAAASSDWYAGLTLNSRMVRETEQPPHMHNFTNRVVT